MSEQKKQPIFVGVDDGHYAVKIVDEMGRMFSVPSRAKVGRHLISWQETGGNDGFYNTHPEDTAYTVDANLPNYDDTRFKEYPKSPLNRVLVQHALLGAGFGGKDVTIVTGLPVSYYYLANGRKDEALIAAKIANLSKGVSCGSTPIANIVKNMVATEAIAAYFDQMMDINGNPTEFYETVGESMVGVIDIGGKTTDCAVVLPGGQQVDPGRSGSSDAGVLQLNQSVESRLRSLFDLDNVPQRMIEAAITKGVVKISGEEKDVTDIVTKEKERLAEQIMAGVRAKIGSGKDLDSVLFVGGGSIVLRQQLSQHFAHSHFPDHPEFANARGMLKIAKFVFGTEE